MLSVAQLSDLSIDSVLTDFNSGLSWTAAKNCNRKSSLSKSRILILDEATTGIDLKTRKTFFESLREFVSK